MYPILFEPIIKEMIWGSESWEISCRANEMGIIKNGEFAGETFARLCEKNPAEVLGKNFINLKRFPILIKNIYADNHLSVQVHPDDAYARLKGETDTGKSELWYILKPPNDGYLIIGLKRGITKEILSRAYENGTVEDCLNRLKVKRGDIINIPAGLIHALTAGTVVAEIQQNSDITYRLYDFGRTGADGNPRPLHVQDALAVTAYSSVPETASNIIKNQYFTVEKMSVSAPFETASDPNAFSVLTCVKGPSVLETPQCSVQLAETNSALIPAALGKYIIKGDEAIILKTSPNCTTSHISN